LNKLITGGRVRAKQQTLAGQVGFEKYQKKTRREQFLEEMEQVVPWTGLDALVRPHYPKGEKGRPPVGLGVMLRVYFLQQWFNLSDPGMEDALYESAVLRRSAGIDLGRAPAPDETTLCKFRHLLERHDLGGAMLEAVNLHLEAKGIRIATGTTVDPTIIHAPSSTKNPSGGRDPRCIRPRRATSGTSAWRRMLAWAPAAARAFAVSKAIERASVTHQHGRFRAHPKGRRGCR